MQVPALQRSGATFNVRNGVHLVVSMERNFERPVFNAEENVHSLTSKGAGVHVSCLGGRLWCWLAFFPPRLEMQRVQLMHTSAKR